MMDSSLVEIKRMKRNKDKNFCLVWYSAPKDGGVREIASKERYKAGYCDPVKAWIKFKVRPRAEILEVWWANTIDELLAMDREEWRTRSLDKKVSEAEKLFGLDRGFD